ncbi:MAG: ribonuclease HI family protein [Deltaproteobacteria bacterium]|nr:ribonuclease HI family protein [Deltaproteobacteria bacterium]
MADGFICKAVKKHQTPDAKHLTINVDGASRGNPGKAGIGAVIRGSDNTIIERVCKYIGIATNNIAEYQALILALETAKQIGAEKISIYSDSELMVKQIKGEYRVKNEGLKPLYQKAIGLLKDFKAYGIIHIEREKNKDADKLANQAIDAAG